MITVATEALAQINELHYSANLTDYPHVKTVMNVGLAFRDKSVQSAYEKRDAATGALIGNLNLSMYGSDDDIFDTKDVPASSSSTMDLPVSSAVASSSHNRREAQHQIDDEDLPPREGSGTRRSMTAAGFADELEDEQGPIAAPSAPKTFSDKPSKGVEENE